MFILYISVIIVFCVILLGLYFFFLNRDKSRYDKLHRNATRQDEPENVDSVEESTVESEKQTIERENQNNVALESYSWEDPANGKNADFKEPFKRFDDDDDTDKKFKDYEEFLRKNLGDFDFDDDDKNEDEDENDLDFAPRYHSSPRRKRNLDFDDFDEKNDDFPSSFKDVMMKDMLNRSDDDDEDDND